MFQDKYSPLPVMTPVDPIDREIAYMPTKAPYDPRWMLAGRPNPSRLVFFTFLFWIKLKTIGLIIIMMSISTVLCLFLHMAYYFCFSNDVVYSLFFFFPVNTINKILIAIYLLEVEWYVFQLLLL